MPIKKRLAAFAAVSALLLAGAVFLYWIPPGGAGIPCPVRFLTGLYCPGCGASRALRSLLHFELYQAFRYNPALVLLLPPILLYLAARAIDYVRTGGNHIDRHVPSRLLIGILAALLVFGVLRNLPFEPFVWLRPTVL